MAITRGEFLKSLQKSIPGMVLGSGVALAAQKVLSKMAAASGALAEADVAAPDTRPAMVKAAKIEFIKCGPVDRNQIALTFDDGPTPGVTDLILDELKRRNLKATFFLIGERVAAAPELAYRVFAEGHEVGNHTFTHPNVTKLADAQVEAEIEKTQEVMAQILNHRPTWFRPPFGALRQNQAAMVTQRGMRIVLWNVDPSDWSQPGEDKITSTILNKTKSGSIILCHDKYPQTALALPPILDGFAQTGFSAVTLSTLLASQ